MRTLTVCFSLLLLSGCSESLSTRRTSLVPDSVRLQDGVSYEVAASVDDQAKAEVQNTPVKFTVSNGDDHYSWERARLFFMKYLQEERGESAPITTVQGKSWSLSNRNYQRGDFNYLVSKTYEPNGVIYEVSCSPRKNQANTSVALLNAQNVARFISTGKFELTLLTR